jgi:hypothetical protein
MPRNPSTSEINQFMSMTNCPDKNFSKTLLKKHNNNIANAVNDYFDNNLGSKWGPDESALKALFGKYSGTKPF